MNLWCVVKLYIFLLRFFVTHDVFFINVWGVFAYQYQQSNNDFCEKEVQMAHALISS